MNTFSGSTPTIGSRVISSDGEELGKVKEVMGDCFKLDVRMQPDYWLSIDTVASSTGNEVRLRFPKDGIKEVKQDSPEHKGFHPHDGMTDTDTMGHGGGTTGAGGTRGGL